MFTEKETGSFCSYCGGRVLERSFIPYKGNRNIVGHGSRNRATERDREVNGYHCDLCGLEYHKLPPKDLTKAKSER